MILTGGEQRGFMGFLNFLTCFRYKDISIFACASIRLRFFGNFFLGSCSSSFALYAFNQHFYPRKVGISLIDSRMRYLRIVSVNHAIQGVRHNLADVVPVRLFRMT